jgi:hypothetical protein
LVVLPRKYAGRREWMRYHATEIKDDDIEAWASTSPSSSDKDSTSSSDNDDAYS